MNEQAIQDAYNLFVQTGYKGDINAFSNLIKTNPNALNDSYNLFVKNGYNKTYDDYKTLVGVNQAQGADLLKKKGQGPMAQMVPKNTTESFVEESLSASQPKAQVAPKQKPGILAQPVPQNTTESFLETVSAEPSTQPIETKKEKVEEKPKEEGQGWLMNTISALDKGFYKNLLGNPIKALGTGLQYTSGKLTGTSGKAFISDALINFGNYFNNAIDELAPQDESFKNSLSDQFAQAFGQVASQVVTAGAGKMLTTLPEAATLTPEVLSKGTATVNALKEIGSELTDASSISSGLSMGQSEFDRAKAAGATDEQAFEAFYKNAAVGSILERVPVMQFMKRFNQASKGGLVDFIKTKGVAGTVGGLEEMSTEVLQQLYANKSAQEIYNTNQDLFEGVAQSGGVGFGVGFLLNAMGANAKLLRKQGNDAEAQLLENQVTQFEQQAKNGGPSSYKLNGIEIKSPEVINNLIETMSAKDLAKANIEIVNDPALKVKMQDKIVTSSIKEQVREANPDLNEPSLNAITQLELDLQKLQGNTTQSGKDKAAAIRQQIKDIQENQLQEEAKTETFKSEENAIQEQSTNAEMLRSEQPELGLREVGEGNTKPTEPTTASTEVITDEKSQEIGTQVGDLVETLNLFNQGTQQGGTPNEKSVRTRKANKAYKKLGEFFGFPYGSLETEEQSAKQNALRALGEMLNQESTKGYTAEGGQNYQFADVNQLMTAYKEDKANGVASPVVQSIDTLLGITPAAAPEVVTETVTEQVPAVSSKTQEEQVTEVVPTAEPVQVDEQLPSRLQGLVDLISLAYFQPFGTTKAESQNRKKTSEESKEKLTELLGADFKNDGSRSDEDKLIVNSLGAIKRLLDKSDKKFKFETIQDLLTAYQNDKTNGVDSDLVKSVDTVLNAERDVADIKAAANEAVAEEGEAYEPITVKDISYDTFTRDNASDYEEDEREGDNGRSYTYFSSISVPIVNNQDGETIGYLVKMADSDGELTFDAQFEDQESISGEEGEVFGTLGAAREAFIEAYNKKKQEELAAEATEKAQEKARQAVKEAKKAAKAAAKEGAAKVEEVQAIVDDLLALDPNDKSTAQKISDTIGKAIKDIEKFEKTSLGVNVALPIIKGILQAVKALIDAGISLQQAIKKVAQDNNITEQQVKDNINIVPILDGFNQVMTKVDALIARQKAKGIADAKIVSNIDTFIRNSDVYKAANDAQKKILEKEGRAKMGVNERRAPSIGRVLGALKDFTNISREEKIQIIKQIRNLSKDAASSLAKEIKEMRTVGKITVTQAANIIARFGKVNLLNEVSVGNFVDYMARVFNDAEYAQKIDTVKKQLSIAKKNIATKIGKADGLMIPLRDMLAINPNLIPDSVFDEYVALVDMFGQRKAVLTLAEKSELTKQVQAILDAVNKEQFQIDDLAFRMRESKYLTYNEDGTIDFAETLKEMLKNEEITQEEADLMRKYKSDIVPQVETEPKSDKEIQAEKQALIDVLNKTEVDSSGLPSTDERNRAKELAKLIRSDAVKGLSVAELKNLLKVIDNINNNFFPHYANLMARRLESINNSKVLDSAITTAKPLTLTEAYAKVKSMFTNKSSILEMIRRNPLANIDQVFGNFKTKEIFNSLLNKPAEASSAYQTALKKVQNILEDAEAKVAKSFGLDPNKTQMSKFKMMTYLIQLEYDSNPDNKQVNPASDFLKATIKHIESGKSRFGERDSVMLDKILSEYTDGKGNIDADKLYKSFNDAEKSAIKSIQSVNESLAETAAYTASVIRGQKFNPLNNYVHLNVLHETEPTDLTIGTSFATEYNNSMRPSTKAKSLIERTGKVSPLNFDVFASAQRGAKFVLLDYNLTDPITTSRMTLNQAEANLQQQADEKAREEAKKNGVKDEAELSKITGKISKKDREVFNAIRDAFEESVENLLTNSVVSNSLVDDVVDYINKQGYRAILAGTGRFIGESSSNIGFALISDPKAFIEGVKNRGVVMSADAPLIMQNVKSKQTSRIFPTDTLSGRAIDTSILSQAGGIVGGKAKSIVANQIQKIWNQSGKKYTNSVELIADSLISTPDKVVMRPMWFGSFANEFKAITGKDVDFEKIAANDEAYMNANQDAIEQAKTVADERSVMTGATDNAFMGVLKGTIKPNQSFTTRAFNNFNNFMTKFLIFEYVTARTGIMAAMGNGSLSRKQGAAVLAAVTTRMIVYTLVGQMLGNGLMGMFFDDEEPEDDKSFLQKTGQALASTFTSLLLGRDFGNATKAIVNAGVETINEKYLDFLREGEYDPYKDSIQFSIIPKERKGKQNDLGDLLMNMGGAFGPALKTANFLYVKATEEDKKKADAIERQQKERTLRVPLEILGNAGFVPLYKDVRKMVMKEIYSSLANAEKNAADKKRVKEEMLQGFETETDMKRYDPELWDRTFGPSSEGYDQRQAEKELKREKEKMEREIKDEEYNYTPSTKKRHSKAKFWGK